MRSRKRKTAQQTDSVTANRLRRALEERKSDILKATETLSLKSCRRLLETTLNLPKHALDLPEHKDLVEKLILGWLSSDAEVTNNEGSQDARGSVSESVPRSSCTIHDLPQGIIYTILSHADHSTLASAAQVCRVWRDAARDDSLYRNLFHRNGWKEHVGESTPEGIATTCSAERSWLARYKDVYRTCCYDCLKPNAPLSLSFCTPPLRLRLCKKCSLRYVTPKEGQRLVTETEAKYRYCLSKKQLQVVWYVVERNPVCPDFLPMRLYRKHDVLQRAVEVHGSVEAVQERFRKKLRGER